MVKNKIIDIEEFAKIFKINVPVNKHFDYYLDVLKDSIEYGRIYQIASDFSDLEIYALSQGYTSAKNYKLDYALPRILYYIEHTKAYEKLNSINTNDNLKLRSKDDYKKYITNSFFLSIDISMANYSILKTLDEKNELCDSWSDLCDKLEIHETLKASKSFRQIVFGNTNPKRLQRLQHIEINKCVDFIKKEYNITEEEICYISHDEIVIAFDRDKTGTLVRAKEIEDKLDEMSKVMNNVPLKSTFYKLFKISKDVYTKRVYNNLGDKGYTLSYKTLFGVPGNKFYKYFKLHVLDKDLDERDLLFMNDGEIAKWMPGEDSIESSFAPEGELSLDEVKRSFSYFYQKLSESLPTLTEVQKRKIINIATNLCGHCMDADKGCHCWNDD